MFFSHVFFCFFWGESMGPGPCLLSIYVRTAIEVSDHAIPHKHTYISDPVRIKIENHDIHHERNTYIAIYIHTDKQYTYTYI